MTTKLAEEAKYSNLIKTKEPGPYGERAKRQSGPTPGPWKPQIFRWPDGKLNGTPSVYAPNGDDGGRHVCELCDNGQLDANANLIAAAPELLEALRECITDHGAMAFKSVTYAHRRLEHITSIARAAIAKAEESQQ